MFKLHDLHGNPFIVNAAHWHAGLHGVTFTDERGTVVDYYEWQEISDSSIEKVNG